MSLRSFRFPMLFLPDGNLATQEEARAALETAQTTVLLLGDGVFLSPTGSLVPLMAFEPADVVTREVLSYQAVKSLRTGAEGVELVAIAQLDSDPPRYKLIVRDPSLDANDQSFSLVAGPLGFQAVS